jgi:hypothetical protein
MSDGNIGDVKIDSLKIGDIDLTNFNQATYTKFEIYEDILNPYGAVASINVVDHSDAMGKNPQTMNGSYDKDVDIRFTSTLSGGEVAFKFKMLQNKNLKDGSTTNEGSGHNKQYEVRCCSPELLNAQGNYMQKNYKTQTSKIVEDIYKLGFKTKKQFEIKDETKGQLKHNIDRKKPEDAYKELEDMHVSTKNQSSLYVTFERSENGDQKFIFTTFEQLFQEASVVTLKQSTTLDTSQSTTDDKINSIREINIPDSFFTPSRALTKTSKTSYNVITGVQQTSNPEKGLRFTYADSSPTFGDVTYSASNKNNLPPSGGTQTIVDPANDVERTGIAESKTKRTAFLSHLSQNYGKLLIVGNPNIKLGNMINLEIFKKSNSENSSGESQFNGKALVVSIKHVIRQLGDNPRYLMELGVVKGSYKEGGDNNA